MARLCVSHAGRATSTSGDDQALSGRENHRWRHQLIVASRANATLSFSIPEASDLITTHRTIETYLMDMDGVLVHEERLIPGADQFIKRLQETGASADPGPR